MSPPQHAGRASAQTGDTAVQVVWFKKDLRTVDHAPLVQAAGLGAVVALYIYEPDQLQHEEFAGHHLTYLHDCLRDLQGELAKLGLSLTIRLGEAVEVLERLSQEVEVAGLWAHEETGNWVSFQRDLRVHAWARTRGIPFTELPQNGVVRRMRNRDGWAATWEARMTQPILPEPLHLHGPALAPGDLRGHAELGVPANDKIIPVGGRRAALSILDTFLTARGVNYMREMSSPVTAETSCSRLSAPLAFGTVSIREVVQATRQRLAGVKAQLVSGEEVDTRWLRSLRSFESRLHWHCHFMQRLESEPEMEFRNLNRALDGLREDDWNQAHFEAWAAGQTGYPMVDACMRMLLATGWLNFRMRAMLVSFASQHLWLHWRQTGLHLARQWLDNEPGIHWSQMQMQSSTVGINQVRIYSPTKQARDQDPDGAFIRRWVPELQEVPIEFIHAPWEWTEASGLAYPPPIVDESVAARTAKNRIYAARCTDEFQAEAARVYQKHGSRKKAQVRRERSSLDTGQQGRRRGTAQTTPHADSPSGGEAQKRRQKRTSEMIGQPDLFGQLPPPIIPSGLPESWQRALNAEFSADYFRELTAFLKQERREHTVYPPAADVFNALRQTPLEKVKVLILGQDPYHGPGQAHGLSFSVRPGVRVPPSLRNIFRELASDLPGFTPPPHGDLRPWTEQGVLLLNAVLTVRAGMANSHKGRGWETFTDAVIRAVDARFSRVVFILWGAYARKKARLVTGPQHVIIESAHPSPLSEALFFNSRPFSQANAALESAGQSPIDWRLPNNPSDE